MASSPEKKHPPRCGSRGSDSEPIACTDPPLSESPKDLGHDPRDEEANDADHPGKDSDDAFASTNLDDFDLLGDIDEDSDDDGFVDEETTCPGQSFTKDQAKEIIRKWLETYDKRNVEYAEACDEFHKLGDKTTASCPVFPLKPLPETTDFCITKSFFYHGEYKTDDTSETALTIGQREPKEMLQIFSMRLSSSMSYPISVYGIFAVRDDLDPLRNYVFNSTRDDPIIIEQYNKTYMIFGFYPMTPLFQAVIYSSVKCVKLLVEAGADVNPDCISDASLGSARGNDGSTECLNFLLEVVANRNAHNDDQDVNKRKIAQLKSFGSKAVEREDYISASAFYTKAMDLDPNDATLFSNRSLCWLHMGDGQKALLDALECRELRPDWPKACYRHGAALMILKDYKRACEALFDGFKLDPDNAEIERALREAMESLKISKGTKAT